MKSVPNWRKTKRKSHNKNKEALCEICRVLLYIFSKFAWLPKRASDRIKISDLIWYIISQSGVM